MEQTLSNISASKGVAVASLQKRFQRAGRVAPSASDVLSVEQLSFLDRRTKDGQANGQKTAPTKKQVVRSSVVVADMQTFADRWTDGQTADGQKTEKTALLVNGFVTSLSVLLTGIGLYYLVGLPGVLLSCMVAAFLFFSVWVSSNNMKGDTSSHSISRLLTLEFLLVPLHAFTFYNSLNYQFQSYSAIAVACGLACLVPFISYNAVQAVRNYYSE